MTQKESKRKIVYTCPFIPAEWIAAHGFLPSRILPEAPDPFAPSRQGMCPFARATLQSMSQARKASATLFTTTCDQMRRASETVQSPSGASSFLFNVPSTRDTEVAKKIYAEELRRLGRFLERIGGREPSSWDLARVMTDYEWKREKLKSWREKLSAKDYSQALAEFHRTGRVPANRKSPHLGKKGIRLALVGGPMLSSHFGIFNLIERFGGTVMLDATTSGERTMPAPFGLDTPKSARDPFAALVEAYFNHIPDAFRRPNRSLYQWLGEKFRERDIQGILFRQFIWCDTWRGEMHRMREWAKLPFLSLDVGDDPAVPPRTATRIESFLEMLN
ncbi:MAG: 2-hydroxyacyl-CoA dehydratase family protein [Planctomycetes bacterium]|nr:2-hydroxyacyl-CoA dehydratase family protein [Planctomycetota bacterium]